MGTSFVTVVARGRAEPDSHIARHGIWINDSTLQLLLRLLTLHIPEPSPGPEGEEIRAIRDQWLLASGIPFIGCVPHDLEEIVMTHSGLSLARSALTSLTLALKGMPKRLPGQLFSLLGMEEPGSVDISTDQLLAVASDILGLLDACGQPGGRS